MKPIASLLKAVSIFTYLLFLAGCSDDSTEPQPTVDLSLAKFQDFELAEIPYSRITITHPEVLNGQEVFAGRINIVVPVGTTQLRLTPKTSNFVKEEFTVSPTLGVVQDFAAKPVVYTITSEQNPQQKVRYEVTIVEGLVPGQEQITSFIFSKAKNAGLPGDVEAVRIVHPENNTETGTIYVFVPVGTDFSNLTPTIGHQGGTVYYSQDPINPVLNSTGVYPEAGLAIDFAYPKVFYAFVKHGNTSPAPNAYYQVIVDVKNPFRVETSTITTPNVAKGAIRTLNAVATITNQGNHPLGIAAITHQEYFPANLEALRAFSSVPNGGLLPGRSTDVHLTVSAQTYPPGTYRATAVFAPRFQNDLQNQSLTLLNKANITFSTTITD